MPETAIQPTPPTLARTRPLTAAFVAAFCLTAAPLSAADLDLRTGDRVVFVGNTFAERLALFGHLETLLTTNLPERRLTFRNLAWSADTTTLRPRPLNFGDMSEHLNQQNADVIFACFGMNESFKGPEGLDAFRNNIEKYLADRASTTYNDRSPPRIVLLSPIAHENLGPPLPNPAEHNRNLRLYTNAMRDIAQKHEVPFVDLFTPTRRIMNSRPSSPLTINGIHLSEHGDRIVAQLIIDALDLNHADARAARGSDLDALEQLRRTINHKNQLFFYRWRAVNGEYIYGRRKEPFGVVNFPPEMEQLDRMIADLDSRIHDAARPLEGLRYP